MCSSSTHLELEELGFGSPVLVVRQRQLRGQSLCAYEQGRYTVSGGPRKCTVPTTTDKK